MRIRTTVLLGSLLLAGCTGNGSIETTQEGIVHGYQLPASSDYEWLVQVTNDSVLPNGSSCSGILLTDSFVLTAAHCGNPGDQMSINAPYAGSHYAIVRNVIQHPDFVPHGSQAGVADVEILELSAPISMPAHPNWAIDLYTNGQIASVQQLGFGDVTNSCSGDGTFGTGRYTNWTNVVGWTSNGNYQTLPNRAGQIVGPGDSGGPSFRMTTCGWALAGIHTLVDCYGGKVSQAYDIALSAGFSIEIWRWIDQTIGRTLPVCNAPVFDTYKG
jgi:trypsin